MIEQEPPPHSKARLSDIAEHVGVSVATVSRVLNGKSGVSDEVRRDVVVALDLLGYERPKQLRVKSRGLVGLIVPELTNPIFPAFAQTLESLLAQRGYTPLLCTQSPGGTTEDEYISMLLGHSVDAMIFVSGLHADNTASKQRYRVLREQGLPVAFVNGWTSEVDGIFASIDDTAAMADVVRHLTTLGHRRIGLACGPDRFVASQRKIAAFRAAVAAVTAAPAEPEDVAISLYTVEGGYTAAAELLDRGVTAVVCASDLMALGAVRAVTSRGCSVPGDVSVVGYDDSPLMAYTDPPLTTVRQPVERMSHAVVSALIAEIEGYPGPRSELLFQTELVVRGSTGLAAPHPAPGHAPPAVPGPQLAAATGGPR